MSIGALEFDGSDPSFNTIVAAIGSESSISRLGGFQVGVIRSIDGGNTWNVLGTDTLYGYRLAGIAAYKNNIVTCAVGWGYLSSQMYKNGGTFLSVDTGNSWIQIDNQSCTDMIIEPMNPSIFYRASLKEGPLRSIDSGKTWISLFENFTEMYNTSVQNMRMAIHQSNTSIKNPVLFCGFLRSTLLGLWRSELIKQEWKWTLLDSPQTNDNGTINGLNPTFENNPFEGEGRDDDDDKDDPGSQGALHFSIAADPTDSHIVYVGGDRQPTAGNGTNISWPNSIGAYNYDGRLFKCDESLPRGNQCIPLTHKFAGNNSAPHADSRDMAWDIEGNLLETDDGGIYKRIEPRSCKGNWVSLIGNAQVQEAQGATYLGSGYYATGNQDTGTTFGFGGSLIPWQSIGQGDGGLPRSWRNSTTTILYWCYPFLAGFSRVTIERSNMNITSKIEVELRIDANNTLTKWEYGPAPPVSFYQNYAINRFNPDRLFFGITMNRFAFESFDAGKTLQPLIIALSINQLCTGFVYGGILNGKKIENLSYISSIDSLASRDSKGIWKLTSFPPIDIQWPVIVDISAMSSNFNFVAVLCVYGEVAYSQDGGNTWKVLSPLKVGVWGTTDSMQKKIAFLTMKDSWVIVVSGRTGTYVYQMNHDEWLRLGSYPNAFVNDMGYDDTDDVLWVSTLGRSVWQVKNASIAFSQEKIQESNPKLSNRPDPDWKLLTFIFSGLTIFFFILAILFFIGYLRSRSIKRNQYLPVNQGDGDQNAQ